jgi:heptosyltransferase III
MAQWMTTPSHILLCRTDSIGDVMVTLPLVGWIKQHWPKVTVSFAGRSYTRAVIEACPLVDHFVNADDFLLLPRTQAIQILNKADYDVVIFAFPDRQWMELIAKTNVKKRIATANRWASWRYATHRVWFSRKNSDLHESILNAHLLRPLGLRDLPSLQQLIDQVHLLPQRWPKESLMPLGPFVVMHPKSKGSAAEWGVEQFRELASRLSQHGLMAVITGTAYEGDLIRLSWEMKESNVVDLTGQLTLEELIGLLAKAQGVVAASTGPLHIAAALGVHTVGLFTPKSPMHAGRWAPLGAHVRVLVAPFHPTEGHYLAIGVDQVVEALV